MNYVLVGNSAAGLFAAESIRQQDPRAEITVLTADAYPFYSRCLTTYFLAGDIPKVQLFLRSPEDLQALRLRVHYSCTVTGLDPVQHLIHTIAGEHYPYDKCLIATGASAVPLDIPGSTLPEVFTLRHLDDAQRIKAQLAPKRQAVMIGGGLVSLKSAYALLKQGLNVSVIVSSGQILSQMLNGEAANLLQEHLVSHGLNIILHQDVTAIEGTGCVQGVRLRSGRTLPADLVIVGKGVRPNIQPFLASGLAIRQGILVNEHLETNLQDVYAAGDVAEAWDHLHQTHRLNPIWPNATTQGRTAGANMSGLALTYPGSMGMNAVDFFGLRIISAGIVNPPTTSSWHVDDIYRRDALGHPRYQRLVWQGEKLKGFVLLGDTERAGLITALIQSGQPLSTDVRKVLWSGKRSSIRLVL
ncbi:NADH-dependent phenylglyoxylate dehydrogenase subunit epsilon [Peptococcaceae bacterium CEB3]|nr:NADH-dependent phenylglyoxylate dehydrogenase subunit epsilon [Peptococcaceae bacterium CEB3]